MLSGRIGKAWLSPRSRHTAQPLDAFRITFACGGEATAGSAAHIAIVPQSCAKFPRCRTRYRPAEEDRFCSLFRLAIGKGGP